MTRGVAASDANIDLNAPFSGVLVLVRPFKLIHFNAVLSVHVSWYFTQTLVSFLGVTTRSGVYTLYTRSTAGQCA